VSRRWRIPVSRRGRFFPLPPSTQTIYPVSIPSGESWGIPTINDGVVRPTSIPSAEAWGTPTITPGTVTVSPVSIPSAESWGTPSLSIKFDLSTLRRTARRVIGYELICMARLMQPSGAPTFVEVDSILWSGLNYTDELSKPQTLQASVAINSLSDDVKQRLRAMRQMPSEMWLYRDGELIFAGPLLVWNTQGPTLTLQAVGLLGYLRYWTIDTDLVFTGVDQFTMVKTMVDNWQASSYGHFGIDTTNVGLSGVLRDATYKQTELHNVGQRVDELGRRENGFNTEVDPTTRQLRLWYPTQGVDRASGPDPIVFDELTITNNDVAASVAPDDVASDVMGTGTGTGDTIWGTVFDPDVRAQFGRTSATGSFDGVSDPATLTDHLSDALATRNDTFIVPGPDLRVVEDVPLSAYGVGDTVAYRVHDLLGVDGAFRIRKRSVSVDTNTVEQVKLEFV
jgi:hypothetical protein